MQSTSTMNRVQKYNCFFRFFFAFFFTFFPIFFHFFPIFFYCFPEAINLDSFRPFLDSFPQTIPRFVSPGHSSIRFPRSFLDSFPQVIPRFVSPGHSSIRFPRPFLEPKKQYKKNENIFLL